MGVIKKIKQKWKKRKLAKQRHKDLEKWEKLYKNLQSHPLTQAKIVNEELLSATNETLDEVKRKLSEIDVRLKDVESYVHSDKVTKKPKKVEERIIVPYANLSESEKQIISHIKDQGQCDASVLAEALEMSRSNASLKLNKLYKWNFLGKGSEDKRVTYWLNTQKKE